mmetsp:Transcript_15705/g.44847  ORF Transcript_15705/g.44847 Transcript_15705/m.44847 type:complete len:219 (-) Transcript_15705:192-848(-)
MSGPSPPLRPAAGSQGDYLNERLDLRGATNSGTLGPLAPPAAPADRLSTALPETCRVIRRACLGDGLGAGITLSRRADLIWTRCSRLLGVLLMRLPLDEEIRGTSLAALIAAWRRRCSQPLTSACSPTRLTISWPPRSSRSFCMRSITRRVPRSRLMLRRQRMPRKAAWMRVHAPRWRGPSRSRRRIGSHQASSHRHHNWILTTASFMDARNIDSAFL